MVIPPDKVTVHDLSLPAGDKTSVVKPLDEVSAKGRIEPAYPQRSGRAVISTYRQPLRLIYRASMDHLGEILGIDADETGGEQNQDREFSPEETAAQILAFVNSHFEVFRSHNTELTYHDQLERYLTIVEQAIEKGFEEARTILTGLKIAADEIEVVVGGAHKLVKQGLASFHETKSSEYSA
jgi:hypothetical protein